MTPEHKQIIINSLTPISGEMFAYVDFVSPPTWDDLPGYLNDMVDKANVTVEEGDFIEGEVFDEQGYLRAVFDQVKTHMTNELSNIGKMWVSQDQDIIMP
jgi:hypothetical protein